MNVAMLNLARGLADRGVAVDLLTRAERQPAVIEIHPGVTLHTLAAGPRGPLPPSALPDIADEFGEAVATLARRPDARYDLLHAHFWLSGVSALPVALELGLPLVQTFHNVGAHLNAVNPDGPPETVRRLRSESFLAGQVDAIICGSAAEVTVVIDVLRAPQAKTWVIPPGVDTNLFTPNRAAGAAELRRRLGLGIDQPLLVVAGSIQPLKAQELAVRMLAAVHDMRGWAPVLVLAGEPTPGAGGYRQSISRLAMELGVESKVRFVGSLNRTDLADLFAAASLTLIPSRSETFAAVALESAASGTPVVAYRSPALAESMAHGESGVLVSTQSLIEWARTVSELLDDTTALARLGDSARRHAEGFTWAAATSSLHTVYESLLEP